MFFFPFILLFLAPSTFAEVITLEPVTVQSSRLSNERRSVQVITEKEIADSNAVYVGDLLRQSSGVDWTNSGFAYIRGGTGAQTLVFVDGIRMNDPSDPNRAYDFSSLDLSQVERIEIFKGPQSVAFGSDAMAGVISISTKKPHSLQKSFSLLGGDQGTFRATGSIASPIRKGISVNLRASHLRSDGPSTALVSNGDIDQKQLTSAGISLNFRPSIKNEVTLGSDISYLKQDLDAGSFLDDPNLNSKTLQKTAFVRSKLSFSESSQSQILLSRMWNRRAYDDRADPGDASPPQDSTYYGTLSDLDLSHRVFLHSGHEVVLGGEWKKEKIGIESRLSPVPLKKNHLLTVGVFFQDRLNLGRGWTTEVGLRHERPSDFGSSTQKKIGLEKRFGSDTKLNAAFGTGFKVPALYSLYDSNFGNPNLQIEKSQAFELGIEQIVEEQNLIRLTGFATRYKDMIGFNFANNRSENISQTEIKGLELESHWLRSEKLSFKTHTTYLHAWDRLNKTPLPRRAKWKGGLIVDHQSTDQIHIQGEWWIKSAFRDSAVQTVRTPMASLFHLSGDYRFSKALKTTLRIENLFDRKYFETLGYTTLGRSFYAGLEAQF